MKLNPRDILDQVDADLDDEVEAAPSLSRNFKGAKSAVNSDFSGKVQKMRTPEGKSIKAENAQYKSRDGKRKF